MNAVFDIWCQRKGNKFVRKGHLFPSEWTVLLPTCISCQILFYKFSWPHISQERHITLAQIDARTIKKPLACNANSASLSTDALISVSVQRRILVNPGEVITLFCFQTCKLKCAEEMAVSDFLLLFVAISGVKGDFITYRVLLIFCGRSVSVWLGWINGPIPASSGQGWQVPPSHGRRTQDHLWGGRDLATSLSWQSHVSHSFSYLKVFPVHFPQDKRCHPCCSGDRLLSQSRELFIPHVH